MPVQLNRSTPPGAPATGHRRTGPTLNTKPGSSSKRQHQVLVIAGLRAGFDLVADIRSLVGGSIRKLSVAECSDWIKHFSGVDLANPPGQKPKRKKGREGVTRMITPDQVQQIRRMSLAYFEGNKRRTSDWLIKNFQAERIEHLATAHRAGQVIMTLKTMAKRKESQ